MRLPRCLTCHGTGKVVLFLHKSDSGLRLFSIGAHMAPMVTCTACNGSGKGRMPRR